MKIDVLLFAQLKEAAGKERLSLELEEGTRVRELAEHLMSGPDFYRLRGLPLLYAINENFVSQEDLLREGDTLALMTPVSGGAR